VYFKNNNNKHFMSKRCKTLRMELGKVHFTNPPVLRESERNESIGCCVSSKCSVFKLELLIM